MGAARSHGATVAPRALVAIVSPPGPAFDSIYDAVATQGLRALRVEPAEAEAALRRVDPGAVILCGQPELAGRLAAVLDVPLFVLEPTSERATLPESSRRAVCAFAASIGLAAHEAERGFPSLVDTEREIASGDTTFSGLRALVIGTGAVLMDGLTRELRARGATVAVAEPDGRGLTAARGIDPQVALIANGGDEALLRLRDDPVLRWAFPIQFPWAAVLDSDGVVSVRRLSRRVGRLVEVERQIRREALSRDRVDITLHMIGPGRLLRVLADLDRPLRVAVRTLGGRAELELAPGLVLGARWWQDERDRPRFVGPRALTAFLCVEEAWVRVESVDGPRHASLVMAIDEALAEAQSMIDPVADELPTEPRISRRPSPMRSSIGSPGRSGSSPDPASLPALPTGLPPPPMLPREMPAWGEPVYAEPTESGVQRKGSRPRPSRSTAPEVERPAGALPAPEQLRHHAAGRASRSRLVAAGSLAALLALGLSSVAVWGAFRLGGGAGDPLRAGSDGEVSEASARPEPPAPRTASPREATPRPATPQPTRDDAASDDTASDDSVNDDAASDDAVSHDTATAPESPMDKPLDPSLPSGISPGALRARGPAMRIEDPAEARRRSDALREVAERHGSAGDWRSAERVLQRAFLRAPTNPHVCHALATLYLSRGHAAAALPWAERAVTLRRRRATYRVLLGDVLDALGRAREARAAWRRALEIDPAHTPTRRRLRRGR